MARITTDVIPASFTATTNIKLMTTLEKLGKWWNSRTEHTYGRVVMTASVTRFLWGFLKVHRFRAYHVGHIDAVKPETPHRTWRSVTVGLFSFSFRLPKFVEDRCD